MKTQYIEKKKWTKAVLELLQKIIVIVEDYQRQGYRMTLRQLYYQLVSKEIIPNRQREYSKLSRILTEARMCGLIDWDFIEDRIRVPKFPNQFDDISDAMNTITQVYRLDRWNGQKNYVEVWVEKDALSGVLNPVTHKYHIHLLVNRGYSSASAMHDSALRIGEQAVEKNCIILYFGDHDPSGEDMVRDIRDRMQTFGCNVIVKKVALTIMQVKQYHLPPNPAKLSDPRSGKYIDEYGNESWELDALPPDVLVKMVENEIMNTLNWSMMKKIIEQENVDKKRMKKFGNEED